MTTAATASALSPPADLLSLIQGTGLVALDLILSVTTAQSRMSGPGRAANTVPGPNRNVTLLEVPVMATVRSTPPRLTRKALSRFWAQVCTVGPEIVRMPNCCWIWTGSRFVNGYGRFNTGNRTLLAHRFAWWLYFQTWPDQLVLHQCDVKSCVRPEHLFLGSHADNSADMVRKGRSLPGTRNPAHQQPENCLRGEQVWRAVLTADSVRTIRELRKTGMSSRKIAALLGVSRGCVQGVLRGRNWRHVQ